MKQVKIKPSQNIYLSVVGTTNTLQIIFPIVKEWKKYYGDGEFSLAIRRPVDKESYLAPITTDNENIYWTVTSTDTQYPGPGQYQLIYYVNGNIAKTVIGNTVVDKSLGQTKSAPAPWSDYIKQVLDAKERYIATEPGSGIILDDSSDGWVYIRVDDTIATKDYVDEFGGKIDSISVNNVPHEPDGNKNVNINITVNDELAEVKESSELGKAVNVDLGYNVIEDFEETELDLPSFTVNLISNYDGYISNSDPDKAQVCCEFFPASWPDLKENYRIYLELGFEKRTYNFKISDLVSVENESDFYNSDFYNYIKDSVFSEEWEGLPSGFFDRQAIYYKELGGYKDNPIYFILGIDDIHFEDIEHRVWCSLFYTENTEDIPQFDDEAVNTDYYEDSDGNSWFGAWWPNPESYLDSGILADREALINYLHSEENIYIDYLVPTITEVDPSQTREVIITSEKFEKAVESLIPPVGDTVVEFKVDITAIRGGGGDWTTLSKEWEIYQLLKDAKEARAVYSHPLDEALGEPVVDDYFKIISLEKISRDGKKTLPVNTEAGIFIAFETRETVLITTSDGYVESEEVLYLNYGIAWENGSGRLTFNRLKISNDINYIYVNGINQPILFDASHNRYVDITVPTQVSQLINNSGYITRSVNDLFNYYNSAKIDKDIGPLYGYGYCVDQSTADYKDIRINLNDFPNSAGNSQLLEFLCWFENGAPKFNPISYTEEEWERKVTFNITYLNGTSLGTWPHDGVYLAELYRMLPNGSLSDNYIQVMGIPKGLYRCILDPNHPKIIKLYDVSSLYNLSLNSIYMGLDHEFVHEQTISINTEVEYVEPFPVPPLDDPIIE